MILKYMLQDIIAGGILLQGFFQSWDELHHMLEFWLNKLSSQKSAEETINNKSKYMLDI